MNFLTQAVIKAIIEAWAKAQGAKQLAILAASDDRDFSFHVPLSGQVFELWTRSVDSPSPIAKNAKRLFVITLSGKTFYFYGRVR